MLSEPGAKSKILVVDDQARIRQLVQRMLGQFGYSSIVAEDGYEAIKIAATQSPISLALIDLTMPTMDGMTLATKLRGIDPGLPIVLMSGFDLDRVLDSSPALSPAPILLAKPFKMQQLVTTIEAALLAKTH